MKDKKVVSQKDKKVVSQVLQVRLKLNELADLDNACVEYLASRSQFIRNVLVYLLNNKQYREIFGSRESREISNHERNYTRLVMWLDAAGHSHLNLADILSISDEAAELMWNRYKPKRLLLRNSESYDAAHAVLPHQENGIPENE